MKKTKHSEEKIIAAVKQMEAGRPVKEIARELGVTDQTLYNWVKADREGKLAGAGAKPVSPEQMELARLRAEVARLKMERDISYGLLLQAGRTPLSLLRSQMSTYPT